LRGKRIVIVGTNAIWAIETYYAKYLTALGWEIYFFDCSKFYNANSISYKLRIRLVNLGLYDRLNSALIKYCDSIKPNAIWIFKGVEVYSKTLILLKQKDIFLINYNPDHPFIRTSVAHGGKNIPSCVPIYDLHFSYRTDLIKIIEEKYSIPTKRLPFGFELSPKEYSKIKGIPDINKVAFIGTPDRHRVDILTALADKGFKIDIYSRTYQHKYKLTRHNNINTFQGVFGLAFWTTIRQYRVQLNFLREHNLGSHNQRTFEVPGSGGILLTPYTEEQNYFFKENEEVFFYNDINDMYNKIEILLMMSKLKISEIRENAREVSLQKGYTYFDRAKYVSSILTTTL